MMSPPTEYADSTVYISVSMIEVRRADNMLQQMVNMNMESSIGLTVDPDTEDAEATVRLLLQHSESFMDHVADEVSLGTALLGMLVWKGTITVDDQDKVSFNGLVRRPLPEDYESYTALMVRQDIEAEADLMEHAKHCPSCAARMGLDPSEVTIPEDDTEVLANHMAWFPREPGEA